MNITYRSAKYSDLKMLAGVRVSLIDEDSGLNDDEKKSLYKSVLDYMTDACYRAAFISFVAFDGKAFVGTASACLYSVLPGKKLPSGKNAYIQNVYVDPQYRRQGIGKKLVSMITDTVRKQGYSRITLHATKAGEELFKSCGFISVENLGLTEMVCPE